MPRKEVQRSGIGRMLISSRSFDEYVAMFDLRDEDLASSVLDCPAGASSFTATARARGFAVTACDIAYADVPDLLDVVRDETIRGNAYIARQPDRYAGGSSETLSIISNTDSTQWTDSPQTCSRTPSRTFTARCRGCRSGTGTSDWCCRRTCYSRMRTGWTWTTTIDISPS